MKLCEIKDKRIAIGMYGISYLPEYNHWMNWKCKIDWRNGNYKDTMHDILSKSNKVDHYLSTYHSDLENELLSDFSPVGYKFTDYTCSKDNKTWVLDKHNRIKEILGLFNDSYDYYIITRFDLDFSYDQLVKCNISNSSINVTSKHGCGKDKELICDSLYIFDNSMFNSFKSLIHDTTPKGNDHWYYHNLHRQKKCPKISYMIEGSYYSHNSPVWKIKRQRIQGKDDIVSK